MPEDSKRSDSRDKSLVRGTNKIKSGRQSEIAGDRFSEVRQSM